MARLSGVWRRIRSRIACRYAWPRVSSTPSRASSIAGAKRSAHGSDPYARWASSSPSAAPGTAHEAAPIRNTWVDPPEKSTSTASISRSARSRRPRPGMATKKSRTRVEQSRARWTSMKPPAPGPVRVPSETQETRAAATAASTAFPPSRSTRAPASAVSGWPAATAPLIQGNVVSTRQTDRPFFRPKERDLVSPAPAPPARLPPNPHRSRRLPRRRGRGGRARGAAGPWRGRRPGGRAPDLAVGGCLLLRQLAPRELAGLALGARSLRRQDRPRRRGRLLFARLARQRAPARAGRRGGSPDGLRTPARRRRSCLADGRRLHGDRGDAPRRLRDLARLCGGSRCGPAAPRLPRRRSRCLHRRRRVRDPEPHAANARRPSVRRVPFTWPLTPPGSANRRVGRSVDLGAFLRCDRDRRGARREGTR